MFAREELGRSRLLRALAAEVHGGRVLTSAEVNDHCSEHVTKQQAAALSVAMHLNRGSAIDKALTNRANAAPGSDEYRRADEILEQGIRALSRRQPQNRHNDRCESLYVDLDESGTTWSRPQDLDRARVYNDICDAVNDYSGELDRLNPDGIAAGMGTDQLPVMSIQMDAARRRMTPKPQLLGPTRPKIVPARA